MKEFKNPRGHYAHLLKDRDRMAKFFAALADVIRECGLHCYGSVVRVADLKRFNAEFGTNLDSYSLALMECLSNISLHFPGIMMDLRVDRGPSKLCAKIDTALTYLKSYEPHIQHYQNVKQFIKISPFDRGCTFRNLQGMQAADFAAWEMRKNIVEKDDFLSSDIAMQSANRSSMDYWIWLAEKKGEITIPPQTDRKSFRALNNASEMLGGVWDYRAPCDEHKARCGIWRVA